MPKTPKLTAQYDRSQWRTFRIMCDLTPAQTLHLAHAAGLATTHYKTHKQRAAGLTVSFYSTIGLTCNVRNRLNAFFAK